MADAEDFNEDDLFADLYDGDEPTPAAKPAPTATDAPQPVEPVSEATAPVQHQQQEEQQVEAKQVESQEQPSVDAYDDEDNPAHITTEHGFTGTVGIKEDG